MTDNWGYFVKKCNVHNLRAIKLNRLKLVDTTWYSGMIITLCYFCLYTPMIRDDCSLSFTHVNSFLPRVNNPFNSKCSKMLEKIEKILWRWFCEKRKIWMILELFSEIRTWNLGVKNLKLTFRKVQRSATMKKDSQERGRSQKTPFTKDKEWEKWLLSKNFCKTLSELLLPPTPFPSSYNISFMNRP